MESTARISTGSIFLLVLYKAAVIEAYRSVVMEAFRDQSTAIELLSYKDVLYEEATEEWYAQRVPDGVEREDCNCTRFAQQFGHLMEEYRPVFHLCTLSITNTECSSKSRELPFTHVLITVG